MTAIAKIEKDGQSLFKVAGEVEVIDEDSYTYAGEVIKNLKAYVKAVKIVFDPLAQKAHETHQAICDQRSEWVTPATNIEHGLKLMCGRWKREQERKQESERKKLQKAAEKATPKGEHVAPVVLAPAAPKIKGISYRVVWGYRITNIKRVPRQYLIENDKMLKGLAQSAGSTLKIPGVEFYSSEAMSARGA